MKIENYRVISVLNQALFVRRFSQVLYLGKVRSLPPTDLLIQSLRLIFVAQTTSQHEAGAKAEAEAEGLLREPFPGEALPTRGDKVKVPNKTRKREVQKNSRGGKKGNAK